MYSRVWADDVNAILIDDVDIKKRLCLLMLVSPSKNWHMVRYMDYAVYRIAIYKAIFFLQEINRNQPIFDENSSKLIFKIYSVCYKL